MSTRSTTPVPVGLSGIIALGRKPGPSPIRWVKRRGLRELSQCQVSYLNPSTLISRSEYVAPAGNVRENDTQILPWPILIVGPERDRPAPSSSIVVRRLTSPTSAVTTAHTSSDQSRIFRPVIVLLPTEHCVRDAYVLGHPKRAWVPAGYGCNTV